MKLIEIQSLLAADPANACREPDREISKACAADLLSDVLAFTETNALLLTGLNHGQVLRTAEMLDLAAVVLVRGKQPSDEMISLSEEKGIPLLRTQFELYTAVGKLYEAGLRGEGE